MAQVGLLEDNMRIAKLCATMLQYAGHQVIIYEHPKDCLDALLPDGKGRNLIDVPIVPLLDLLILDLNLPDITGMEVLNTLCAHPQTQLLPIIFCTAATPAEIERALHVAPHASFLEKPFTYHALITTVQNVLEHQNVF